MWGKRHKLFNVSTTPLQWTLSASSTWVNSCQPLGLHVCLCPQQLSFPIWGIPPLPFLSVKPLLQSLSIPCLDQQHSLGILAQIRVAHPVHHPMFLDTLWKSIWDPHCFHYGPWWVPSCLDYWSCFLCGSLPFIPLYLFSQQQTEWSY